MFDLPVEVFETDIDWIIFQEHVEEAWILGAEAVVEEIDDRFFLPTDMRETCNSLFIPF